MVCAVGLKGATFISSLLRSGTQIHRIVSYDQEDDRSRAFQRITALAASHGIELIESQRPTIEPDALAFLVGWQYVLSNTKGNVVVFHDSLLPRYRGFAPTASALIKGEREIGVTALSPTERADEGPIICQAAVPISHPIKIAAALELQSGLMAQLAHKILAQWKDGTLAKTPQDSSQATYCLWRDEADYLIDWSRAAPDVLRFVDAVGYPYAGARTMQASEMLIVEDVSLLDDLVFEIRDVGKIWRLDAGRPVVVCGSGLLRLDRVTKADGSPYQFKHLRVRLGSAGAPDR